MSFNAPLDLQYWLVSVFSGNIGIFIAVSFITIGLLASYFRMSNLITLISFGLFVSIMWVYIGGDLLVLVIVFAALFVFWALGRLIKS